MIKNLYILLLICLSPGLWAQVSFLDYNPVHFHSLERINSIYPDRYFAHSSVRYADPIQLLGTIDSVNSFRSIDQRGIQRFIADYDEIIPFLSDSVAVTQEVSTGIFNSFYKTPQQFFSVSTDNFELRVNPVLHLTVGNNDGNAIYQNTRGVKLRGSIDQKIYFYSSIYENQREFLPHVNSRINRWNAIPGQGFFKSFESGVLNSFQGFDFLNAQAYTGLKISPSVDLQLGYGNNFIGDGYRSLLLSDYSHNYFYLKLSTNVWKFHYQNLFTELSPISTADNIGDNLLPKKYMVAHYLNFKASPRFSIGIFETVVFSRNNQFEWQYLNPVILYRSIEQFLDSPDNVLIGLNASYIPINGTKLYGQLLVDEFRTDQVFAGNGWWANKVAYQLGLKHFDLLGINTLDLQIEYNTARPFTYSHRVADANGNVLTSFSHFNQALAHPLGANFSEFIVLMKYQPHPAVTIDGRFIRTSYGDDLNNNIGFDFLLNNDSRLSEFGNFTGQGTPIDISLFEIGLTYEVFSGYYIDLRYLHRNQSSLEQVFNQTTNYASFGIRANVYRKEIDY